MTDLVWVRSHVELLLQREWDVCRVLSDPDGDFPWHEGTAACWVSVLDDDPPFVRVFAHAAFGMKPSLKLLRELNDIQQRLVTACVVLHGDAVVISQTVSALGLTQPVLAQAMGAVASAAADVGPLLAVVFDGSTPFPATVPHDEDAP